MIWYFSSFPREDVVVKLGSGFTRWMGRSIYVTVRLYYAVTSSPVPASI